MDIDSLRKHCLSFPQATEQLQWGDNVCFKVGGKLFAIVTLDLASRPRLTLKSTAEECAELFEREGIAPAPYVGRYHWIGIETLETVPSREMKELIARSYELVSAKLPKKPAPQKPPRRKRS
jgi:predicted DNA-binding protein (MmcQ/YjbR family)